jgi:hypothetical protein
LLIYNPHTLTISNLAAAISKNVSNTIVIRTAKALQRGGVGGDYFFPGNGFTRHALIERSGEQQGACFKSGNRPLYGLFFWPTLDPTETRPTK